MIPFRIRAHHPARAKGYMLLECMAYISVVFVVLGVGYLAFYKSMRNAADLRRTAQELMGSVNVGELWRADLRMPGAKAQLDQHDETQVLQIEAPGKTVWYGYWDNAVFRRRDDGPWVAVIENVKSSTMHLEQRKHVTAWKWELELLTRSKSARMKPLFTFVGGPQPRESQ
jgi:hypothetical protein